MASSNSTRATTSHRRAGRRGAVPTRGNRSLSHSSRGPQVKPKPNGGRINQGGPKARKRRGRLSSDAKARKARLAAKMKRGTLLVKHKQGSGEEDDNKFFTLPKGAPYPEKVFNDELEGEALEYEAEELKDSRINGDDGGRDLVKWVGWTDEANTWEPEVNLRNSLDLIAEFDESYPKAP